MKFLGGLPKRSAQAFGGISVIRKSTFYFLILIGFLSAPAGAMTDEVLLAEAGIPVPRPTQTATPLPTILPTPTPSRTPTPTPPISCSTCATGSISRDVTRTGASCGNITDEARCNRTRVTVYNDCNCRCSGAGTCANAKVRNIQSNVLCAWSRGRCALNMSAAGQNVCGGALDPCRNTITPR